MEQWNVDAVRGSMLNDYSKQKFTGGDKLTDKKGLSPTMLSIVGTIITIGGAALMFTAEDYSIQSLVKPLGVFFIGIVISSVAVILSRRDKRKEQEVKNGNE